MTFTVCATVSGTLTAHTLERALRCLERRHPLLLASIERHESGERFVFGQAKAVPMAVTHAAERDVFALACASLNASQWTDEGPRAQLTWVTHDARRSSLLLRFHHTVADGISGILAMRDLLRYTAGQPPETIVPLPSPGQNAFFPPHASDLRAKFLATFSQEQHVPPTPALRPGVASEGEPVQTAAERLVIDPECASRIASAAKDHGATVHGALYAAVALSVAAECGGCGLLRLVHPVDLRRYLSRYALAQSIGEALGCYVSAITTEHTVDKKTQLGELARDISAAVRLKKSAEEPLLASPVQGELLVHMARQLSSVDFRRTADQLFLNSFSLSNLGRLEDLGIDLHVSGLHVSELYFVANTSMLSRTGGSAVSFRGSISLQLTQLLPLCEPALTRAVAIETRRRLSVFGGGRAPLDATTLA